MLTPEQITEAFMSKLGTPPDEMQIQIYSNFDIDTLNNVLNRNLAIQNDPTYDTRLAEDYKNYLAATPEQRKNWPLLQPNPLP